jgi:hypothetical protein
VKSGHIGALNRSISPEARAQRYETLTYNVLKVADPSIILGDSIVLFDVGEPSRYRPFLDKDDVLNAVYLPLDRETVLVGSRKNLFSVDSSLREGIARCSLEFFIATERSHANELLMDQIGADAHLLTQCELELIFNEDMQ